MEYADHHLFPLVREPDSRWERAGLSPAQERAFNRVAAVVVALFAIGWVYTLFVGRFEDLVGEQAGEGHGPVARVASRITASPLSPEAPPEPVFLVNQIASSLMGDVEEYKGESGAVNVALQAPGEPGPAAALGDSLPAGARVELQPAGGGAPVAAGEEAEPGIWNVVLRMRDAIRPLPGLHVITLVPLSERRGNRIGSYVVGRWPFEGRTPSKPIYATPKGLVQVTPENRGLRVSEHFTLGDFLTKGQQGVWPKYTLISPRLLDKLELTIQELQREGHPVEHVFVVSGFRTPVYNEKGGDPRGRADLSRHMYGDAADVAIDNNHDGYMDDLNGDGRVDVKDARVLARAADRVEKEYPNLVGGIGVYAPTGAHHGFVHIDTRGYRARWGPW